MIGPHCDDEDPDRTPLYAAIASGLVSVVAAVLPGYLERRHEREVEREDRVAFLERENARLRSQDDEEGEE